MGVTNKVLVGGITPEGEHILQRYLDKFMPDTVIEPLKAVGIKGKIKNHAVKPEVLMVIIDDVLYQSCVGTAQVEAVLKLPKVHRYTNDEGLTRFLVSKFGKLDGLDEPSVIPPDKLMERQQTSQDLVTTVADDEDGFLLSGGSSDPGMEEELESLRNRLAQSELMVHNLEMQLSGRGSESESDLALLTGRIRELEEKLRNAESASRVDVETQNKIRRAEELVAEYDDLKKKLKAAKDENADLTYEHNKQLETIKSLEASLKQASENSEAASECLDLRAQVDEKANEITSLKVRISELEDEIRTRVSESKKLSSEMQVLQKELSDSGVAETVMDSLREELNQCKERLSNLQVDYESREEMLNRANKTVEELNTEVTAAKEDANNKGQELYSAKAKITELEADIELLKDNVASLEKSIAEKDAELNNYCKNEIQLRDEVRGLRDSEELLGRRDAEIKTLRDSLEEQEQLVSSLSENLKSVRTQLSDVNTQLTAAENRAVIAEDASEENKKAYDRILAQKKTADDRIVELEGSVSALKEKLLELEEAIRSKKDELERVSSEKIQVDAEVRKLNARITTLQTDIVDAKTSEEHLARLEKELLEERRTSSRLAAEVEVFKKSEDSSSAADLRLEIARLQNELDSVKTVTEGKANVEIGSLKTELIDARKRCADLEIDLADRDEQVREISSGVFGRMANIAIPRAVYDVTLPSLSGDFSKFICVAGGSSESNQSLYAQVRKACEANPKKRIIVFDLTVDSCIDREFGVVKINTPINWLSGSEGFQKFIAGTRFANVKVVSTALAYLNNLYLLNVNWQSRLSELGDFADLYILNIGCMNNITTKVLFNTFSQVMRTYVIVKATPINLRTTILNLTGLKNMSANVTTVCVNFDDKASRDMYQRLAQKFKAQILRDTEVLAI